MQEAVDDESFERADQVQQQIDSLNHTLQQLGALRDKLKAEPSVPANSALQHNEERAPVQLASFSMFASLQIKVESPAKNDEFLSERMEEVAGVS